MTINKAVVHVELLTREPKHEASLIMTRSLNTMLKLCCNKILFISESIAIIIDN